MEQVSVAGVMIRAGDADALARWYGAALGVEFDVSSPEGRFAAVDTPAGPLNLAIVRAGESLSRILRSSVKLTFRVADLDARLRALQHSDLAVDEEAGVGRFAYLRDPEGNEIALWEPVTAG